MRKKSVSFSKRNQRWFKVGLRGGVQLEWYKRVVPAGLNKITCGGEQTNTLSSDNEHLPPCGVPASADCVFVHLVFPCLLRVRNCA